MRRTLAAGLLVLLLGGGAVLVLLRGVGDGAPAAGIARDAEATAEDDSTAAALRGRAGATATASPHEEGGVPGVRPETPATGTLRVHVRWAGDDTPLAGVDVRVLLDSPRPLRVLRTDAEGRAVWEHAPAASLTLTTPLGGWTGVEVPAGGVAAVDFALPDGVIVSGTVRDVEGAPIEGARLWLGRSGFSNRGEEVARTARDGTYRLRTADTDGCLGAHAAGYAPSLRRFFEAEAGATVALDFALEKGGGALDLRVVDADGAPVVGATVLVGSARTASVETEDGSLANLPTAFEARTDEDGRAALDGLPVDSLPVLVRAKGLPLRRDRVAVRAGERAHLDLRLGRPARVRGVVTDAAGRPVAGATLRWEVEDADALPALYDVATKSDEAGAYVLDGLPLGDVPVVAERPGLGRARTRLALASGADVSWDPVLPLGLALAGRVVDAAGRPRAGWRLFVSSPRWRVDGEESHAWVTTDADGRFVARGLADVPHDVEVFPPGAEGPPLAGWRDVRPGPDERRFEVPGEASWAFVKGRVLDARGAPVALALLWMDGGVRYPRAVRVDAATGAFRIGPLVPGRYAWTIGGEGVPRRALADLVLRDGEERDVGAIVLPAVGGLAAEVRTMDGSPVGDVWVDLYDGDRYVAGGDVEDGRVLVPRLYVGTYRLELGGDVAHADPVAVTVRADETTRVQVVFAPGVARSFRLLWPLDLALPRRVEAAIRDASGRVVRSTGLEIDPARLPTRDLTREREEGVLRLGGFTFGLPPGAYTLEARADGGRATTEPFRADPGGEDTVTVRLGE